MQRHHGQLQCFAPGQEILKILCADWLNLKFIEILHQRFAATCAVCANQHALTFFSRKLRRFTSGSSARRLTPTSGTGALTSFAGVAASAAGNTQRANGFSSVRNLHRAEKLFRREHRPFAVAL
jgi:hypothetical protein